jgi:amino acid permease
MLAHNLPEKIGDILRFFLELGADFGRSRYLFLLFLAALLLAGRHAWARPLRFLGLTIVIAFGGYVLSYVVSYRDLEWHLLTSGDRTTGQLMAAIVLFLASVVGALVDDWHGGRPLPVQDGTSHESDPA